MSVVGGFQHIERRVSWPPGSYPKVRIMYIMLNDVSVRNFLCLRSSSTTFRFFRRLGSSHWTSFVASTPDVCMKVLTRLYKNSSRYTNIAFDAFKHASPNVAERLPDVIRLRRQQPMSFGGPPEKNPSPLTFLAVQSQREPGSCHT